MNLALRKWACALGALAIAAPLAAQSLPEVHESASEGDFPLVANARAATILCDSNDFKVVQIATGFLAKDIESVTGMNLSSSESKTTTVLIGTLDKSVLIREAVEAGKIDVTTLRGQWESYVYAVVQKPLPKSHSEIERALVIIGSDRRGTAYGVFGLSEAIGVSPWYWWADVPPPRHTNLYVSPKKVRQGPPSVKYRGIFINDEDWGLQPWAAKTFEPETGDIGPKTYAKVFELLLRLRANFCWPAMHDCTKAFNYYPANKQVADDYAIVMGASHCEPLLCNNVSEWDVKKDGEWDYVTNAKRMRDYWEARLTSNGMFENVYTVGLRGIHDSGMPGGGTLDEKARRLETIISDQRDIISRHTGHPAAEVPQIFCPYKEVLDVYRRDMKLPDDVTIVWADDNHGYIRQLSSPEEQKRSGRSGVYYHLSYWGSPADYLWLSSQSPSLISYEMTKAYRYGADRLWVFNVGDIKPAEKELTFAMELAWDIERWTPQKAASFPREWAGRVFGAGAANPIGALLDSYYKLAQRGKPEHLDKVSFSPAERAARLTACRQMIEQATALRERIPAELKDAYFELVFYPVMGAALQNEKYLFATDPRTGTQATNAFTEIQRITRTYNEDIAGGKWRNMMDWQPRKQPAFGMPRITADQTNGLTNALRTLSGPEFSGKTDAEAARILTLHGFGNGAVTIEPITAPSVAADKAPSVRYEVDLPEGSRSARFRFLPMSAINKEHGLRASIRISDGTPQTLNLHAEENSREWSANVLRGFSERTVKFEQSASQKTRIEIRFPDPGVVLLGIDFY